MKLLPEALKVVVFLSLILKRISLLDMFGRDLFKFDLKFHQISACLTNFIE